MIKFIDNYPLKHVTTLSIGGPAKKFVAVKSEEELQEALDYAKQNKMDCLLIGGGSNLLVNDHGIDCLVIKNEITGIQERDGTLIVKSGTLLQNVVDYSISHGLSGLQKLTGIPGTVGGAVFGNAGAYGQTISDHIISVVILGSEATPESDSGQVIRSLREPEGSSEPRTARGTQDRGARMTLGKNQCGFNYRNSIFKQTQDPILEVTFQLENGDPKTLQKEADDVLSKRLVKYPKGIKCPGSFFQNIVAQSLPEEILDKIPKEAIVYGKLPAGYLLESVGAKGQRFDGIEIASYHANLFVNKDRGTAKAFYTLAKTYAQKVRQKFGITLAPEVQLINLPPIT